MQGRSYRVGIYTRLSKDDGTDGESISIDTQKHLLTKYVQEQNWQIAEIYVDDGYSGTNFERPDFKRMLRDIEDNKIDCVITKDLSRLGRNYLQCGYYLEIYFPEHNVRYIALSDGVDTLSNTSMDITPFRNLLNEMYVKDTSKKIKTAIKTRFENGKCMVTYAPYGYLKDPNDHNHLIVDEEVRPIIKTIYDLCTENGWGVRKIMNYLRENKILKPSAYLTKKGITGFERFEKYGDYSWSENGVRAILRSPVYAGNLVGYKRIKLSMKSKKKISKKPEEWKVIYGTHEGIISQEQWDLAQKLITSRRHEKSDNRYDNIFANIIKCADCGYAMCPTTAHRRKRPEIIDCIQYVCNNYDLYGKKYCTQHSIEARTLQEIVLKDINYFANFAMKDETNFIEFIKSKLKSESQNNIKTSEKEENKLNKRLNELDRLFKKLYEDRVTGNITERNYKMMSDTYQQEQDEIVNKLNNIELAKKESESIDDKVIDFSDTIKKYDGITELTRTIVVKIIDKITISEKYRNEDGTLNQDIRIYYKSIGELQPLKIEVPAKRVIFIESMPKRVCKECGKEYQPMSNVQKYCSDCRKIVRRRQGNESKRKSRERAKQLKLQKSA